MMMMLLMVVDALSHNDSQFHIVIAYDVIQFIWAQDLGIHELLYFIW